MSTARTPTRLLSVVALVTALGLLLTACGSSDSRTTTDPRATSSTALSGGAGPGGPIGLDREQLDAIQRCLEAAGLGDAFPTDLPTGRPSDLPTSVPSGEPPSGLPSGGPRGGLGAFADPDVQAALRACGIELPSGPRSSQSAS